MQTTPPWFVGIILSNVSLWRKKCGTSHSLNGFREYDMMRCDVICEIKIEGGAMAQAVGRRFVSPRTPRFAPKSFQVRFTVDKVTLGQSFLRVLWISCQYNFTAVLHVSTYSTYIMCGMNNRPVGGRSSEKYSDAIDMNKSPWNKGRGAAERKSEKGRWDCDVKRMEENTGNKVMKL
jgi:hypothetical protein